MIRKVLLSDICSYVNCKTPVEQIQLVDYVSTENLLQNKGGLSVANKLPSGKVTVFQAGDVLVSNIRPYFKKIWLADRPGGASNDVLVFRKLNDNVYEKYLYYILADDRFFAFSTASASGSKMPRGDKAQIMNYSVKLPPLEAQKKIANILSSLDEKIELNRRMNETLEQLGQALFRHYFVDNPEAADWDIVSLTELCDRIASGGTPSTRNDNYYGGDIQWYSTKELKDDFVFCSEKTITGDGLNESSAKLFPVNTVMMAIYAAPTVGRLGILTQEAAFNQATCGLVAKPSIGCEFIYLYLLLSRSDLNNMANGAAQQNISVGKVRNFAVMKPDDQTILKFKEKIQPIFEKIKRNSEETITLTSMRDSLLLKLISGEIEV